MQVRLDHVRVVAVGYTSILAHHWIVAALAHTCIECVMVDRRELVLLSVLVWVVGVVVVNYLSRWLEILTS